MMDDMVCFEINGRRLYLDEELVEFDIPLFFICRDADDNCYSVLCTDSEQLNYVVVCSNKRDILDMLNSKITMRALFLKNGRKWRICAGEDYYSDTVEEIDQPAEEELPVKGAFFELRSEKIPSYIRKLENEQYNKRKLFLSCMSGSENI